MISGHAFDRIDLLDKAADASVKRETILANNLANADTPNYKRKDIDFSKMLMDEVMKLAAQNTTEPPEEKYYPREYGIEYSRQYGSLPNSYEVPTEEEQMEAMGIDQIDPNNVGNLIEKIDYDTLRPRVFTEYQNLSYRIDKNNVDPDTENVELSSEQIKYRVLTTSITNEFARMKSVLQ